MRTRDRPLDTSRRSWKSNFCGYVHLRDQIGQVLVVWGEDRERDACERDTLEQASMATEVGISPSSVGASGSRPA